MFPQLFRYFSHLHCELCELAKYCRTIYPISNKRSLIPLNIVHYDVWGSSLTVSLFGFHYFVTFVDDYSRTMWVYLLKTKSDVLSIVKSFVYMVTTQFDAKIHTFRSDNGGEYLSGGLSSIFYEFEMIHRTTCRGTSEQNSVAERKNRHLLEVTRALMVTMNVTKTFWFEVL